MNVQSTNFGVAGAFEVVVESTISDKQEGRLARVAFVVGGVRLGTDEFFDVGDIFDRLSVVADYNTRREHCSIFEMPAHQAFEGISQVLLGASDDDEFAGVGLLERFRLWFHSTLGESWLLMVSCGDRAKVLFTTAPGEPLREVEFAVEPAEAALRSATEHLRLMRSVH